MTNVNVIRKVKHKLTNDEKHLYGVALAESIQGKKELEDEKKASNSEFKALLDDVQKVINEKSATINSGHEFRDVECKVEKDYSAGKKIFTDIHTGDVVAEETLSNDEMQTSLSDEFEKVEKSEAMVEAQKRTQGKTPTEEKEAPKPKKGKAKKEVVAKKESAEGPGIETTPPKGPALPPATTAPPEIKPEGCVKKDENNEFEDDEPFPKTGGVPSIYDSKDKKQDPQTPAI